MREIYLAGGCFWGLEKYLSLLPGAISTEVGYANGRTENPTYEAVCHEHTGHAETVKLEYDDGKLDLGTVLKKYFEVINPTSINRQGPDIGSQYRTGIYYTDKIDLDIINEAISQLELRIGKKSAIEVEPLKQYFRAEEYHQKYLDKNPAGYCHINLEHMEKAAVL